MERRRKGERRGTGPDLFSSNELRSFSILFSLSLRKRNDAIRISSRGRSEATRTSSHTLSPTPCSVSSPPAFFLPAVRECPQEWHATETNVSFCCIISSLLPPRPSFLIHRSHCRPEKNVASFLLSMSRPPVNLTG